MNNHNQHSTLITQPSTLNPLQWGAALPALSLPVAVASVGMAQESDGPVSFSLSLSLTHSLSLSFLLSLSLPFSLSLSLFFSLSLSLSLSRLFLSIFRPLSLFLSLPCPLSVSLSLCLYLSESNAPVHASPPAVVT